MKKVNKVGLVALGVLSLALAGGAQALPVKIVSVSPLSGDLAPIGTEVKRGAELAVQDQLRSFKALGIDLQLDAIDDQATAKNGTVIATALASSDGVLGVIGALNSGVTKTLAQGLAGSNLPIITPASTNDGLTGNGWKNFYRMVTTDSAQGVAAAGYLAETLRPKKVFVISDNTAYGNGLTRAFQNALKPRKIPVAGYVGASSDAQIASVVAKAKASGADLIYYGGTDDVAPTLLKALRAAGVTANFMGGDGLDSPSFLKRTGIDAVGVLYSTGFGPVNVFNGAQAFTEKYEAAYKTRPSGVAIYAYDATTVLLEAVRNAMKALGGNMIPTRQQINEQLRKTNMPACASSTARCNLISGAVAFDPSGERMLSRVFVMKLNNVLQAQVATVQTVRASDLK